MLLNLYQIDLHYCARLNRVSDDASVRRLFACASRLGDGVAWYFLMLALPIFYGIDGLRESLHLALTAIAGWSIYRVIKATTARPRPFAVDPLILARTRVLDRYSFPSGHTLHAVSLSIIACQYHPDLAWVLVPFSTLVALSRPILGVHFPSDVAMGAGLGWGVAWVSGTVF